MRNHSWHLWILTRNRLLWETRRKSAQGHGQHGLLNYWFLFAVLNTFLYCSSASWHTGITMHHCRQPYRCISMAHYGCTPLSFSYRFLIWSAFPVLLVLLFSSLPALPSLIHKWVFFFWKSHQTNTFDDAYHLRIPIPHINFLVTRNYPGVT